MQEEMQKFKLLPAWYTDKKDGNISLLHGDISGSLNNRKKFTYKLGYKLKQLCEMNQAHGAKIQIISKHNKIFVPTDGLITTAKLLLMIQTADCLPIVFFDPVKKTIAAVHVGWQGAMEKIFLEALMFLVTVFGTRAADVRVGIGPGARKCCYIHDNFSAEVLPEWQPYIKKVAGGKALDLVGFAINKLKLFGVKEKNIEDCGICTICNKNYFSHYRSQRLGEPEGRFATVIGL